MVLKPDILAAAIDAVAPAGDPRPKLLMSPRGKPLTQARARELAAGPGAVIVCGRFEGIDQRVIDARSLEEVSIGDYVLAGGEVAAMVLLEAVVRLIPGVLGAADSHADESFENGLLEYPQYTRPQTFEGRDIPAVLTGGDHGKVAKWRREQAEALTKAQTAGPAQEVAVGGSPPPCGGGGPAKPVEGAAPMRAAAPITHTAASGRHLHRLRSPPRDAAGEDSPTASSQPAAA